MKWERLSWSIGGALLALAFLVSSFKVLRHRQRERDQTVIRIVHYHLEPGTREAFEDAARAYAERNPGVVVQPIAVPRRLYLTWIRTRLVGDNAPDLVETLGDFEELLPRYFEPIGAAINRPNPYAPPEFANRPWRDAFHDALSGQPSFSYNLLENYSIPLATSSVRVFVNLDRYAAWLGHEQPPASFAEFLALCERAALPPAEGGLGLRAMAGSRQTSEWLLNLVFSHATQRLTVDIEPTRRMFTPALDWQAAMLRGDWNLRSPAVRHGLRLIRDLGRHLPPGFLQLQPEDALLTFTQNRALFIVAASHDAASLRAEAPFRVGAFSLPLPPPSEFSFGPIAEISNHPPATFVVTRGPNQERALDFLRFLTSPEIAARFSARSGWPSSVRDVTPPPELAVFMPQIDGYPPGLFLNVGGSSARVYNQNLHRLIDPDGSVDHFIDAVEREYHAAVREDVDRGVRQILRNVAVLDSVLGATWPQPGNTDPAAARLRTAIITESQTLQEEASYRRRHAMLSSPENAP